MDDEAPFEYSQVRIMVIHDRVVTGFICHWKSTGNMYLLIWSSIPHIYSKYLRFSSFALMLGIFIQRSGLTIVFLLLSYMLEAIVKANIDDYLPWLVPFFPMESISALVPLPFYRYAFQEIQDYVDPVSVAIALRLGHII